MKPYLGMGIALLGVTVVAAPAGAFDPAQTFKKDAVVLSVEAGGGAQDNVSDGGQTGLEFWNAGMRVSLVPFGPTGAGFLYGALEVGLEPFSQRYTEPRTAFFAGLGAVGRYHFLSLGRLVPYLEMFAAAGGTDLDTREIRSDFTVLLQAGPGLSVFVTDRAAVYGGYRFEHVSNGNTDKPNRGFEAHTGVFGLSVFFP